MALTPFQLLLGKQGGGGADSASSMGAEQRQLPQGSAAVGEVGVWGVWVPNATTRSHTAFVFAQLLQTPAHVLPPPSVLCAALIESLLVSTANRSVTCHAASSWHQKQNQRVRVQTRQQLGDPPPLCRISTRVSEDPIC